MKKKKGGMAYSLEYFFLSVKAEGNKNFVEQS